MIPKSKPRFPRLLIVLLSIALSGFVIGFILPILVPLPNSVPIHAIFAVGIMPLIIGAMTWFTPVLTRTAAPEPLALAAPLLALLSGSLLIFSLLFAFPLYPVAAFPALLGIMLLTLWMQRRSRQTLGKPHPGLIWYRLALVALGFGLIAIMLGSVWPAYWIPLKRVHLHLNTLGFICLTALGTLRVLLPTAGQFQDNRAATWLHNEWKWLVAGTLLIAAGAAINRYLALLGVILWLPPLARLLKHPLQTHWKALFTPHGAAPALAGAILGLLITLASGVGHTLFQLPAAVTTKIFIWAFLLPLVTGTATHLLPLWIAPANSGRQAELKRRMARYGSARALLFLIAGLLALSGIDWSWALAGLALLHFLVATTSGIFLIDR